MLTTRISTIRHMFQNRGMDQPKQVSAIAILFFIVIAILPVFVMIVKSFSVEGHFSIENYLKVFSDIRVLQLLVKSLFIATGVALVSILIGLPLALFLARSSFTGISVCRYLCLIPLFIPSHIHTLAWINLLVDKNIVATASLYSVTGVVLVLGLSYFPLLCLILYVGLSRIAPEIEESALTAHAPVTVLRQITFPLLQPFLLTGSMLVFILSFFNYGTPAMLQVSSFPVEIFTRFSAFYDEGGAAALSLPVVILAFSLLFIQHQYSKSRSFSSISGRQSLSLIPAWISAIGVTFILAITVALPVISLIEQTGSIQACILAIKTTSSEIGTTLLLAVTAATCTTLLSFFLSHYIAYPQHGKTPGRQVFKLAVYLPLAFPATCFGIGLIYLWNHPVTQLVYSTWCILIIAYIARFIPFSIGVIGTGLVQIPPCLTESSLLCQPSWLKRLWQIHLPLAKRSLLLSWVLVFIFTMGELGATLLVIPAGMGTLSLKIYTLMHYGAGPLVAALALILVGINLIVSAGAAGLMKPVKVQ